MSSLSAMLAAFIPIFVAMDVLGLLPFYIAMVDGLENRARRRLLYQAVLTALIVGVAFILLGKAVFAFLGVTVSDFKVAGGLLLLLLAVSEMLFPEKLHGKPDGASGVVPLGVPLIVGPAVLTSLVMQTDTVGIWMTLVAFGLNLAMALLVFRADKRIEQFLGRAGTQAISKVANLLLAAYGVMTIRVGIFEILGRAV